MEDLQRMPAEKDLKNPHARFYKFLNYETLGDWKLVRFDTEADGSCFFHAISNAFFLPYRSQILQGQRVTRRDIVCSLRKELSEKLDEKVGDSGKTRYESLNNGNMASFAEHVPEFKIEIMKRILDSNMFIGTGYLEFIGDVINKDIYILDALRRDVYISDEFNLSIKGDRKSIILWFSRDHFELVGLLNEDGSFTTQFFPDHQLIKLLYSKIKKV